MQPKLPDLSGPLFKHLGHFASSKVLEQGHNPAVSKAQRRFMGACEHGAGYASCPKGMSRKQFRDFSRTKESGLPERSRRG